MKLNIYFILLILISCKERYNIVINDNEQLIPKIKAENRNFIIGDINNDKVSDTAYINYSVNTETNDIECEEIDCSISVKFKNNIPDLKFYDSKGIVIKNTEDLDNDNANEIIVFSKTNEGWWNDVSVWSLKNNTWIMLAKTKAFITEEKDFNNRIIKIDNNHFLIGQNPFEEDVDGNFTEIKIKI